MNRNFKKDLLGAVERYRGNDHRDNWDSRRFGPCPSRSLAARVKSGVKRILEKLGLRANATLTMLNACEGDLQWLYEHL